jgi:hypothetical protein
MLVAKALLKHVISVIYATLVMSLRAGGLGISKGSVLQTIPENRVYVSPGRAEAFVRSFIAFSHGSVVSDEPSAPGVEIGRPAETYRRVRIESKFGKLTVLITDGHLPYPYGREMTGYEVPNLTDTLTKAKDSGVDVLVPPYKTGEREAIVVRFPGEYIAEIHSVAKK